MAAASTPEEGKKVTTTSTEGTIPPVLLSVNAATEDSSPLVSPAVLTAAAAANNDGMSRQTHQQVDTMRSPPAFLDDSGYLVLEPDGVSQHEAARIVNVTQGWSKRPGQATSISHIGTWNDDWPSILHPRRVRLVVLKRVKLQSPISTLVTCIRCFCAKVLACYWVALGPRAGPSKT